MADQKYLDKIGEIDIRNLFKAMSEDIGCSHVDDLLNVITKYGKHEITYTQCIEKLIWGSVRMLEDLYGSEIIENYDSI